MKQFEKAQDMVQLVLETATNRLEMGMDLLSAGELSKKTPDDADLARLCLIAAGQAVGYTDHSRRVGFASGMMAGAYLVTGAEVLRGGSAGSSAGVQQAEKHSSRSKWARVKEFLLNIVLRR